MLSPPGLELRVRGLHAQNRSRDRGGGRPARGAQHHWPAPVERRGDARRLGAAPRRARADRGTGCAAARAVGRTGSAARRHAGASASWRRACHGARAPLDGDRIRPGDEALVRLTLDRPIGALAGDRLVLRDAGASRTIGGGTVIDPFPPARGRRTPARLAQLARIGGGGTACRVTPVARIAAGLDRPRSLPPRAQPARGGLRRRAARRPCRSGRRSSDGARRRARRCSRNCCRRWRPGTRARRTSRGSNRNGCACNWRRARRRQRSAP